MRVLLVGAGGVGDAIAKIAAKSEFISAMCIADISTRRAEAVASAVSTPSFTTAQVDASSTADVARLAAEFKADVILNACDPRFVMPIFDAALESGTTYIDMAMSLSKPHPDEPYSKVGVMLGDEQFAKGDRFLEKNILALVGIGIEPGLSDIFARYASDELFSSIDEFGVRDGANLQVTGYDFAPTFSIWTTIEECLNPPLIFEQDRGFFTTPPFSEPEVFDFPEGIGPVECVNVEHEEVVLMPKWLDAKRVTFKYGLGDEFITILKTIHTLGLDSTTPVNYRGSMVSPRDFLASLLPDPLTLGDKMTGKTCAGTWVKGIGKDGTPREVYLYHVVDNEETMAKWNSQAVVWQTAINPVIAIELLAQGAWKGTGVLGPEALPPKPFLDRLIAHGAPWGMVEMTPSTKP